MRLTRFAISFAALLALSACDYFDTPEAASGDASGDVLPGSVSDEMIATQDLTSQPPALAVRPGEGGEGGADGADSAAVDSAAVDGEAAPVEDAAPEAVEE
jgi:hypothetical protein